MGFEGTVGYAEDAERFIRVSEQISFADVHHSITPLLPVLPSRILDIGAGTGRDAAALAGMGHDVTAVEPVSELREAGRRLHPSPRIEWMADGLPLLTGVSGAFEVILLTAVWTHLEPAERAPSMGRTAALLQTGGLLSLTLRQGPVPAGRRMYDVRADETVRLAEIAGLRLALLLENQPSAYPRTDITWTRLAFWK